MTLRYTIPLATLLAVLPVSAQQSPSSGLWLDSASMAPMKLIPSGDIPQLLGDFEYRENEVPKVFLADLNGDGTEDYLVESSHRLCGTGGCLYALIEGKTKKRIGDFFGSPILVVDQKINGYPVIQSYGHLSAESGRFVTYVFNGTQYQSVSNVYVSGKSLEELFRTLEGLRKVKAAKR
jgi:hypothetical protein